MVGGVVGGVVVGGVVGGVVGACGSCQSRFCDDCSRL